MGFVVAASAFSGVASDVVSADRIGGMDGMEEIFAIGERNVDGISGRKIECVDYVCRDPYTTVVVE